ncbi:SLC13 family permease [Salinicoccus halodurans]|uniref:Sodium-dependent dicarboxylate transporter SdcS n=1 Tax=Salinicoccus halodurans TaxID=407035 RepID=A0A0F7HJL5_9STAP|nr:SLC13 family permease [Salinicoccus halodurans]AKG73584.1 anion transporter [Salinicoccus halodurans]SFK52971.1 solute carrier family 13 (sodium-dependent dicarboxylate transporter), member 2/3/5 [Salinicoccus halodurans]
MALLRSFWNLMWSWDRQVRHLLSFAFSVLTPTKPKEGKSKEDELEEAYKKVTEPPSNNNERPPTFSMPQKIGLVLRPLLFTLVKIMPTPAGMPEEANTVLAAILWVAVWWVTEAVPIPITSLLPLILFPLGGVMEMDAVSASYGDSLIFLFAGSFMIALSMEKWNLHKRVALSIIAFVGTNPNTIILGFMIATAFISMWISNTATTMLMVPIAIAVTKQFADQVSANAPLDNKPDTTPGTFKFGTALMLGLAYSATIGGFGSLIGAPANIILAGTLNSLYNLEISFANWLLFGLPLVAVLIPLLWLYLTKVAFRMNLKGIPGGREIIRKDLKDLGGMSYEEKVVLTVFTVTALAWISRSFFLNNFIPGLDDALIALLGGVALFLIPAKNKPGAIMDWNTALKLPWGILWLFGGGLALAAGIMNSGLDEWIGGQLGAFEAMPTVIAIALIVATITILSEFTSNTATSTMAYPIVAVVATTLGMNPIILMVAANMGATFAYMFPVAAPPNAIVFGTGYVKMKSMAMTGIWLNVISIAISVLVVYFYVPIVFKDLMAAF